MVRAIRIFQFELICVSARTQITQAFLGIHEQRRVAREYRELLASNAALLANAESCSRATPSFPRLLGATLSVGVSLASNVHWQEVLAC